ncbi:hypothetical protein [Actinotalea sp. K2]|uniref:hypothetical protein n=1 Tax=Actinotalea sp. K2 TaxID=2939438 RepID=UPI0020176E60|nr:hypothetical protein [Actinotalea sp. K2]MCL3861427.1 hypothetical protein [Actinotalea sp. K2]
MSAASGTAVSSVPATSPLVGEVPRQGGRAPLDPDRELRRLEVIHRRALAAGRRRVRRARPQV